MYIFKWILFSPPHSRFSSVLCNQFGSCWHLHICLSQFQISTESSCSICNRLIVEPVSPESFNPVRKYILSLFDFILSSFFFSPYLLREVASGWKLSFFVSFFSTSTVFSVTFEMSTCLRWTNCRYGTHLQLLLCANVVTLWSLLEASGNIRPQSKL